MSLRNDPRMAILPYTLRHEIFDLEAEVERLRAENAELRTEYATEHGYNGHLAQRLFEQEADIAALLAALTITPEKVEAACAAWRDWVATKQDNALAALLAAGMEEPK